VGQFAVRGGLVDVFSVGSGDPMRIELWGDEVASIRSFEILDQRSVSELDETHAPLFATRGIQPFHDFPEGPDWWNLDDYKAILGQLPKMRMNFFALHTYPEGGVGPEPTVWIGLPEDVGPDGRVKAAYPSRHFATLNPPSPGQDVAAWGYAPTKTGDYAFGAAALYDRDDYGADYMRGVRSFVDVTPDEANALFDRMGDFLGEAFTSRLNTNLREVHGYTYGASSRFDMRLKCFFAPLERGRNHVGKHCQRLFSGKQQFQFLAFVRADFDGDIERLRRVVHGRRGGPAYRR